MIRLAITLASAAAVIFVVSHAAERLEGNGDPLPGTDVRHKVAEFVNELARSVPLPDLASLGRAGGADAEVPPADPEPLESVPTNPHSPGPSAHVREPEPFVPDEPDPEAVVADAATTPRQELDRDGAAAIRGRLDRVMWLAAGREP